MTRRPLLDLPLALLLLPPVLCALGWLAAGRLSSAATRSSSSFNRFGRPITAFQPGT